MSFPLATPEAMRERWPGIDAEDFRLEVLIADASALLRVWYPAIPDVPQSPADEALRGIVSAMVRRVLLGESREGIESTTESAGPFSYSQKSSNPDGSLFLRGQEQDILDSLFGPQRSKRRGFVNATSSGAW